MAIGDVLQELTRLAENQRRVTQPGVRVGTVSNTLANLQAQRELRSLERFADERQKEEQRLSVLFNAPGKNLEGKLAAHRAGAIDKGGSIDVQAAVDFWMTRWEQQQADIQGGKLQGGVSRMRGGGRELGFRERGGLSPSALPPGATLADKKARYNAAISTQEFEQDLTRLLIQEQGRGARQAAEIRGREKAALTKFQQGTEKREVDLNISKLDANKKIWEAGQRKLKWEFTREAEEKSVWEIIKTKMEHRHHIQDTQLALDKEVQTSRINLKEAAINRDRTLEKELRVEEVGYSKLLRLRHRSTNIQQIVTGLTLGKGKVREEDALKLVLEHFRAHPEEGISTKNEEGKLLEVPGTTKQFGATITTGSSQADIQEFMNQRLGPMEFESREYKRMFEGTGSWDEWFNKAEQTREKRGIDKDNVDYLEAVRKARRTFFGGPYSTDVYDIVNPTLSADGEQIFPEYFLPPRYYDGE